MVKKIMLVDDDPSVAYTVKHGLESFSEDYKITCVDSGYECLEFLGKKQIPDAILLDIMMPGMSGWETLGEIKKHSSWNSIPVIFLSGRTDDVAKDAGGFLADGYIEKPVEIPDLKRRIDQIIKTKSKCKAT